MGFGGGAVKLLALRCCFACWKHSSAASWGWFFSATASSWRHSGIVHVWAKPLELLSVLDFTYGAKGYAGMLQNPSGARNRKESLSVCQFVVFITRSRAPPHRHYSSMGLGMWSLKIFNQCNIVIIERVWGFDALLKMSFVRFHSIHWFPPFLLSFIPKFLCIYAFMHSFTILNSLILSTIDWLVGSFTHAFLLSFRPSFLPSLFILPFYSIPFHSFPFHPIPFHSLIHVIHLVHVMSCSNFITISCHFMRFIRFVGLICFNRFIHILRFFRFNRFVSFFRFIHSICFICFSRFNCFSQFSRFSRLVPAVSFVSCHFLSYHFVVLFLFMFIYILCFVLFIPFVFSASQLVQWLCSASRLLRYLLGFSASGAFLGPFYPCIGQFLFCLSEGCYSPPCITKLNLWASWG